MHMITHWFSRKSPGSDLSIISLCKRRERDDAGQSNGQTANDNGEMRERERRRERERDSGEITGGLGRRRTGDQVASAVAPNEQG